MNRFYSLILISAMCAATNANASRYATPNNHQKFTLESLSAIEGSNIVKDGNTYTLTADTLEISVTDTLELDNNAILKMPHRSLLLIHGHGKLTPADTALITRTDESAQPKGVYFHDDNCSGVVKNVTLEYAAMKYGSNTKPLHIDNCTFKYTCTQMSSSGALTFGSSIGGNLIENCNFIECQSCAIGGGANIPTGMTIRNNYFFDCNTKNFNRPHINITVGGNNDIEITGNRIEGGKRSKVGGISVSNMLNLGGTNKVLIKDNFITNCRFGITTLSAQDARIINNRLICNKWDPSPMSGGSGINITDSKNLQKCYVEGNHIEDHLWGITVIGCGNANIGKTGDKNAADYNPGNNTFVNNGNSGKLYDLYNNSKFTVYAQGNTWNVSVQTQELIEGVITHKVDDPNLGEVIFMPDGSGVEGIETAEKVIYDAATQTVICAEEMSIEVYTVAGTKMAGTFASEISLEELPSGIYLVKAGNAVMKIAK